MIPFIRGGVEAGEPVLVAVAERKIGLLRSELGAEAGAVEFVDMLALGRNPGRIIAAWRTFVAEHDGEGRGARGVGEPVWPRRSDAELGECDRHESLLNLAFDGASDFALLCPYDAAALDEEILGGARANHPLVSERGSTRRNDAYLDPGAGRSALAGALSAPPAEAEELGFGAAHLQMVRRFVWERASDAGLEPARQADLVLAVNELAENSIGYGGGGGSLRVWRDSGSLVCEVADGGSIEDPLVGRERPAPTLEAGRGLWLVHELCDLVQFAAGPPPPGFESGSSSAAERRLRRDAGARRCPRHRANTSLTVC